MHTKRNLCGGKKKSATPFENNDFITFHLNVSDEFHSSFEKSIDFFLNKFI